MSDSRYKIWIQGRLSNDYYIGGYWWLINIGVCSLKIRTFATLAIRRCLLLSAAALAASAVALYFSNRCSRASITVTGLGGAEYRRFLSVEYKLEINNTGRWKGNVTETIMSGANRATMSSTALALFYSVADGAWTHWKYQHIREAWTEGQMQTPHKV